MELEKVLRTRRSIRSYKPDPVPREVVRGLLDQARWTPSWANSQCWQVYVVAGAALKRLKAAQRRSQGEGLPRPDFRMPDPAWPAALQAHRETLVQALNHARDLEPAGASAAMGDFFGAPCLLLLAVDARLIPDYACFDTGLFVQSLCLAAHDQGLGTCILAMAVRHPDLLRKLLPDAEGKAFVIGIALGYPEPEAPINNFDRPRAELDEFVTWV
jgi:nitroreductase